VTGGGGAGLVGIISGRDLNWKNLSSFLLSLLGGMDGVLIGWLMRSNSFESNGDSTKSTGGFADSTESSGV